MLKKIHREGFTWKDSLFIHGLIVVAFFLGSQLLQGPLVGLFQGLLLGFGQDFAQAVGYYASFIALWLIIIVFCLIVKSNRPILRSFWRGLKGNTLPRFLIGLLIGFGLNAISIGAAILHNDIQINWSGVTASFIIQFIIVFIAVMIQCGSEELLYRGYYFQRLRKGYKSPAFAILINPVIFLLAHVFNPGVKVLALVNIYLVGVVMSLMLYYFDSFWLVIAFHTAWNFSQNIIFGLPNSGIIQGFSIGKLDTDTASSSFFYDVDFGVEATGFTTVLLVVLIIVFSLIIFKTKKKPTDIWEK